MENKNGNIIFDMRLASFVTIMKKLEKDVMTNDVKNAVRNGNYIVKFDSYGTLKTSKDSKKHYEKDGKTIELNTSDIIKDYCEKKWNCNSRGNKRKLQN